jgi:hypothetical protein
MSRSRRLHSCGLFYADDCAREDSGCILVSRRLLERPPDTRFDAMELPEREPDALPRRMASQSEPTAFRCCVCGTATRWACPSASSLVCGRPLCRECRCPSHGVRGARRWEDVGR